MAEPTPLRRSLDATPALRPSRDPVFRRLLWPIIWHTIWPLFHWRIGPVRAWLLRRLGADVDPSVVFSASTHIARPWDLTVGRYTVISSRVRLDNFAHLSIGRHSAISQDVYLCGVTRDYTEPGCPLRAGQIVVGDYVWIAAGAFVGPGVTIGDGAVVAAHAVVVSDVEPWTIVAGAPARAIKKRQIPRASATAPAETPNVEPYT